MGRARSDSRSASRSGRMSRSRSRSISRSRSPTERRNFRGRDRSRSPYGSRGGSSYKSRDNPPPSRCLGVFNLSTYTSEKDLRDVFGEFGEIDRVDLVYDRPSGHSRGFGFVYFRDVHDANAARDKLANTELDGHKIRVDYSFTKRGHSPTPGQYMGDRRDRRDSYRDGYDRREKYRDRSYDRGDRRSRRDDGPRRPYNPSFRRRVESYAQGVSAAASVYRRRSRS